ncbi:TniQ protein [Paraburkholderia sp. BL6669N2]|uniref:TniQ family protein n=1 Tax=Paraburkholderia sp. BL6669N2 TaxID=1938807 RepID=UPI000E27A3E7|nr:TniQ family protein [Paraburkholderia sp. BL6669N2]REG51069.1 TniQ protein [Paraburkholderia sp. BL6669N2]
MEHPVTKDLLMTRSVLNPVAPIGVGTPEVESLVSYFCRLAVSHCVSTKNLGRYVVATMQRELSEDNTWLMTNNFSGMSETVGDWARTLSELTSVGSLESLTMRPWRNVIAERSPCSVSARWCPQCLAEDRATGVSPYFRLSWDVGAVTACAKHKTRLAHVCTNCGGIDTRHKSSYVLPGWCTACDNFLGCPDNVEPATSPEIWVASQVGATLAVQSTLPSTPTTKGLLDTIRELVDRLDDGKSAIFARRIGLGKTTVHYWLKEGGCPTLPALLRIASQTGLALPKLLTGDLVDWLPASAEIHELQPLFPEAPKRAPRRRHDWKQIRAEMAALNKLSVAVSLTEAARKLNIGPRLLYRRANEEARILSKRWNEHQRHSAEQNRKKTSELIERLYPEIVAHGRAVNLRELMAHVPKDSAVKLRDVYHLLKEIKERDDSK